MTLPVTDNRTGKRLQCRQRGSAIITVLVVIFVLTMLGTVALIAGYANVALGSNYRQWSEEWFQADMNAERLLKTADEAMRLAEEDAYAYFQNEWYAIDPSASWTAADMRNLTAREQQHFFDRYSACPDPMEDTAGYQAFMDDFVRVGFPKIQQVYARHRLIEWIAANTDANLVSAGVTALSGSGCQRLVAPLPGESIPGWTEFTADADNLTLALKVKHEDAVKGTRQVLDIATAIAPSVVDSVLSETLSRSVKGNPVWSGAITAGGTIRVQGSRTVSVSGDVLSTNAAGDSVLLSDRSDLTVYGNLLAAGDVRLSGSEGSLRVQTYDQSDKFRNTMFGGNGHFFDVVSTLYDAGGIGQIVADATPNCLNWFPADSLGGALLARNLLLQGDGGTAAIGGLAMTLDDVQVDGQGCSVSLLGGSGGGSTAAAYVGIQSRAETNNPNASSSIINNSPDVGFGGGSMIAVDGGVVVPGIIHFTFEDKLNAAGASLTGGTAYYASAESVSGKSINLFNLYQVNPEDAEHATADPLDTYSYLLDAGDGTLIPYYLKDNTDGAGNIDTAALMAWITDSTANPAIAELAGDYATGVSNTGTLAGYTLGFFVTNSKIFYNAGPSGIITPIDWFNANRLAYEQKSEQLENTFRARTERLGVDRAAFADTATDQISDFVGTGAGLSSGGTQMRYYGSDAMVNINAFPRGIIYCRGSLMLEGNGMFTGTIIAEGDVTIAGNMNIVQSDSAIYTAITSDEAVETFFDPGTQFVEDTAIGECYIPVTVWSIGTLAGQKRYDVKEWRESYEFM